MLATLGAASVAAGGCSTGPSDDKAVPAPKAYGPGEAVSYVANPENTRSGTRYRVSFTMPGNAELNLTFSRYRNDEGIRATWSGTNGEKGEANGGAIFTGPTIEKAMSTGKIGAFGEPDKVTGSGTAPNGNRWVAAQPAGYSGAAALAYVRVANPAISSGSGADKKFFGVLFPVAPMGEVQAIRLAESVKLENAG